MIVAPVTFGLISRAVKGSDATRGLFDPTVLPALAAAGYDRSFDDLRDSSGEAPLPAGPTPGCAVIELDPVVRSVSLPPGVALDLGGIGKGFAADLVAAELLDSGASGACVNLGGDLRVRGAAPSGDAWMVEIEPEPGFRRTPSARLTLADGGVATTSSRRRTWSRGGAALHHLIDPRTGSPKRDPSAAVTVIAAEAWQAEVLAKAVFMVDGVDEAEELVVPFRATGRVVAGDGVVVELSGFERFRA